MSWQWYLRWIKPHFLGQPTLFLTNFSPFDHAWHLSIHVYVMTWKRFPLYWPFGRDSHRSPVDSHHKGPVMRNFEVFFVVSLIKKWNKQSSCLWCSCDITLMYSNNDCTLQWRHNGPDGDPNHWRLGCLLKRLLGCISKKTSKLRVTGLCVASSPVTGEFSAQRTSNAENGSIWWRHHFGK